MWHHVLVETPGIEPGPARCQRAVLAHSHYVPFRGAPCGTRTRIIQLRLTGLEGRTGTGALSGVQPRNRTWIVAFAGPCTLRYASWTK